MDCCAPKKDHGKNEPKMETAKRETCKTESSHGGCCGGGNMKLHLLLMFVVFALLWYFGR